MKKSRYQIKTERDLVRKTITLYKQGMSYRQIVPLIGKSRQWISRMINKYHPEAFATPVDNVLDKA